MCSRVVVVVTVFVYRAVSCVPVGTRRPLPAPRSYVLTVAPLCDARPLEVSGVE